MKLLDVENLTIEAKVDGKNKILVENINFSLEKNKILGIVGESGSGKSVTCFSIPGLLDKNLKIKSGKLFFYDKDNKIELDSLSEKEYRKLRGCKISMIFQEPMSALNPVKSCGKQVAEVLKQHTKLSAQEIKSEVLRIFKNVKLPEPERIFESYPHQLSGGQKQRVVIAIAIACKPDLIIADEPTTALDVTVQKEIIYLLKDIQKHNSMSIIFITHDLALISEIADDVLVMYQGKVEEQGSRDKIFNSAESAYTKGLLACRPKLDQKPHRLPIISDFLANKNTFQEKENKTKNAIETEVLIEVKNLYKYFKNIGSNTKQQKFAAVDDFNLTIYKGETIGLVGESGCGKSTLSRAILMLDEPSQGEIFYKGEDITKISQKKLKLLRREMQIIFQDPFASLNPSLNVLQTLMEPMIVHNILKSEKERKQKIYDILQRVGLETNVLKRYPHQFSGGQRQRIGIARALVLNPSFIICDESVSALDISVQAQVLNLLNDLKDEFNFTYLFISHDLGVVKYMSDHLAVMRQGKLIEYGITEEIYSHPKSEYTKNLIDSLPKI